VVQTVKVDRQGRLVLPSNLRKRLQLNPKGSRVSIRLDDDRIAIEPVHEDLDRRVAEWRNTVLASHTTAFTEGGGERWKWMTVDYARRKLGLR
jgi:AbrB family looped-hinge helix DNA binding protein